MWANTDRTVGVTGPMGSLRRLEGHLGEEWGSRVLSHWTRAEGVTGSVGPWAELGKFLGWQNQ